MPSCILRPAAQEAIEPVLVLHHLVPAVLGLGLLDLAQIGALLRLQRLVEAPVADVADDPAGTVQRGLVVEIALGPDEMAELRRLGGALHALESAEVAAIFGPFDGFAGGI